MNFIFLSTMAWESAEGAYAPTQLSLEFARRGHAVVFLQPYKPLTPPDTRELPIRVVGLDELGLPNLLVTLSWRGIYLGALDSIFEPLTAILEECHPPDGPSIVILNAPFDPLVRILPFLQERGYSSVYFPQDDYAEMARLGYAEYNVQQDAYLQERVKRVIALSEAVAARLAQARKIAVVPDAVNLDEFRAHIDEPPPTEILRGQAATLGFWGTLVSSMVDAELVESIALAHPDWTVNLIGHYDLEPGMEPVYGQLNRLPNVHFLRAVPHSQLIRYANAFDVCLVPAPNNDMSRGRDPLKVYEYLAAYKPVVATHMPQLEGLPYVRVAYNVAQTIDAICAALAEPIERARIDAFLEKHTWFARAECFLQEIRDMLDEPKSNHATLEVKLLEALGRAQPIGRLSKQEGAVLNEIVREHYSLLALVKQAEEQAVKTRELEKWASEFEAANRAQQQTLDRIFNFAPLRAWRAIRRRSAGDKRD